MTRPLPYSPDQPEEIRRATLDHLDQDSYLELSAAINAHERQQEEALAAKKKDHTTATPSSAT